jgi:hypothetical protein
MNYASGVKLVVFETQVERAAEILRRAEEEYLKTIPCPHCHQQMLQIKYVTRDSETVFRSFFAKLVSDFAKLFSGKDVQFEEKHYFCANCNKEYDALPSPTDYSS